MTEKKKEKKLEVDKDTCIACGTCYGGIAPELFSSDDEGKSKVARQPRNPEEIEKAKEAVNSCPSQSISY